jgi:hypothetical protein
MNRHGHGSFPFRNVILPKEILGQLSGKAACDEVRFIHGIAEKVRYRTNVAGKNTSSA